MKLEGKNVIVTGAGSGIGKEITGRLLARGCTVVAADRNTAGIADREGVVPFSCDLSVPGEVDRLFDFAEGAVGGIDVFIANAGFAYYEEIGSPDWGHIESIYRVNTFSPIYAAEKMKERRGPKPFSVVITSSAMGFLSLPGYSLYSSTKAAVRAFASAYRYELADGQRLHVVFPIATRTNFFNEAGGSPVPFPSQHASVVARKIISGVERGKNSIFPSRLFQFILFGNRYFPWLLPLARRVELLKFKSWRKNRPAMIGESAGAV